MRTIWLSLAWKDWHEHKWNLVSILAVLGGITVFVALNADGRNLLGAVQGVSMFAVVPLAMFVGMGAAAGERSRGTLAFLQALPVPMWRVALHKLIAGMLTVVVPFLAVLALTYGICQLLVKWEYASPSLLSNGLFDWGTNWLMVSALLLSYLAASFFIWMTAAGVNRKDEVSAAAAAMVAMLVWGTAMLSVAMAYSYFMKVRGAAMERGPFDWILMACLSTVPGGLMPFSTTEIAAEKRLLIVLGIPLAMCVHAALAASYVLRFGRISNREIRSPMVAVPRAGRLEWLGSPRRSAFTALAWKQFREAGPVALAGFGGILGLFVIFFIADWQQLVHNAERRLQVINAIAATMGFAVAIVLGAGVFREDVSPRLNNFWRSRPISPNLWYWTKFAGGLAVTLATTYLPIVLIAGVDSAIYHPHLMVARLAQISAFAAAVAMICLVRNTVYAAILSIAVVYLGVVAAAIVRAFGMLVSGRDWPADLSELFDLTGPQLMAGLIASFIVSTLVGWLAVRNDWGQKSVR